jgi:hypothetical protein
MAQQDYLWELVGLVGWADGVVARWPGVVSDAFGAVFAAVFGAAGGTLGVATVTGVPKP